MLFSFVSSSYLFKRSLISTKTWFSGEKTDTASKNEEIAVLHMVLSDVIQTEVAVLDLFQR